MFDDFLQHFQHFLIFIPVTFMALFHVVNPIGSGILFLNLTPFATNTTRRTLARKIAVNAFVIMSIVLLVGIYMLKLFGITIPVVQVCGGMMIFNMGWQSLQKDEEPVGTEGDKKQYLQGQADDFGIYQKKAFYPFTFPFTVGPGTIAVTLTISAESLTNTSVNSIYQYLGAFLAIMMISLTIYLCYSYADYFIARMSDQVRKVIMKILSFILACIGVQIIFNGITEFIKLLHINGI